MTFVHLQTLYYKLTLRKFHSLTDDDTMDVSMHCLGVSTSSVTWLALIAICSTVMSSMLLVSCLEAPPVLLSSIV